MSNKITLKHVEHDIFEVYDNAASSLPISRTVRHNIKIPAGTAISKVPFSHLRQIENDIFYTHIGLVNYPPPFQSFAPIIVNIDYSKYNIEKIEIEYGANLVNVKIVVTFDNLTNIVQTRSNGSLSIDSTNKKFKYMRLDYDPTEPGITSNVVTFNIGNISKGQVISLIIAEEGKPVSELDSFGKTKGLGYSSLFNFKFE